MTGNSSKNNDPHGDWIKKIELEGYLVLNHFLAPGLTHIVKNELDGLDLTYSSRNPALSLYRQVHYADCPNAINLIAHERMLIFLRHLLGQQLVCMSTSYGKYSPGYKGMPLHTDTQPYGSDRFGALSSAPISVRVFYYLDDLSKERSPLRVVPYSHLCLHGDAHPYQRIRMHPEEKIITCQAGSAIVINQRIFHAAGANLSSSTRAFYSLAYRPLWAGPVQEAPNHDQKKIAALPPAVRDLFKPPNSRNADPRLPLQKDGTYIPLGPARWNLNIEE